MNWPGCASCRTGGPRRACRADAAPAAPAAPKLAVLPTERNDTDPDADDTTGSIMQPPAATIPIDIGEPSAFELPVAVPEEKPPVIRTPLRLKSDNENRESKQQQPATR